MDKKSNTPKPVAQKTPENLEEALKFLQWAKTYTVVVLIISVVFFFLFFFLYIPVLAIRLYQINKLLKEIEEKGTAILKQKKEFFSAWAIVSLVFGLSGTGTSFIPAAFFYLAYNKINEETIRENSRTKTKPPTQKLQLASPEKSSVKKPPSVKKSVKKTQQKPTNTNTRTRRFLVCSLTRIRRVKKKHREIRPLELGKRPFDAVFRN